MQLVPIPRDGIINLPGIVLSDAAKSVIAGTAGIYTRGGYVEPWLGYLGIDESQCVGGCGFTSPPVDGAVEIAYFTFPGFENRGMATRMAQRLVLIAQEFDPSVKIIAHTLAEENASNHILKKLGFALSDTIDHPEDGKIWKWSYALKVN